VLVVLALAGGLVILAVALRPPPVQAVSSHSVDRPRTSFEVAEVIYDGRFGSGWEDGGWGPHEIKEGQPAKIQFTGYGGVIFRHSELAAHFGALVFQYRSLPSDGYFLEVSLDSKQSDKSLFPHVPVEQHDVATLENGFREALIPLSALSPFGAPFDRVIIKARKSVSTDWVPVDKVVLTKPGEATDASIVAPVRKVSLTVSCDRPATPISPLIYGISFGEGTTGETAHRIGGNPMTRLNWELGVWNTGSDWFFENTKDTTSVWDWIQGNYAGGFKLAMVVPIIGWVAKDATSVGFPVATFGAQRGQDPKRPEAGDGVRPDGSQLRPGPPTATSMAAPPETIRRWIETLREKDRERGGRGVDMYILDNEPNLWHGTHRDVHPDPLSYDELLDRTIRYGSAIRAADPEAVIAGPAEWGWSAYFYSAKDTTSTWMLQSDRHAHGGVPLLPWYLGQLADHEKRTGVRILDVVDVHFYPQAEGVYGKAARTDPETSALRLRATRALWDPTYADESWIKEHVELIPRLKDWIAQNYPGRDISIGEWSFGAEGHISGGLAIAEVLGRFGQQGIKSAFYWGKPEPGTPALNAFRAYRNYDGKGAHFLEWSIPTQVAEGVSLFASRDDSRSRVVAVMLNLDPIYAVDPQIDVASCGRTTSRRVFRSTSASPGITESGLRADGTLEPLPPYSLEVIEWSAGHDSD
jgi:hypothetical protein